MSNEDYLLWGFAGILAEILLENCLQAEISPYQKPPEES